MGLTLLASFGYVLLLLLDLANSVSNRRCFPLYDGWSLCFTRPNTSVALSWSDAQQWCSNIGATLPILQTHSSSVVYANALGYFGLSSKTMWIGANSTFDINVWYWTNGTRFTGAIDHGNNTLRTHAHIIRNGTDIKIVAANPRTEYAGTICQPSYLFNNERQCSVTPNSYWSHGKCYTKSKYTTLWNNYAHSYCGGIRNTATLDGLTEISHWIDDKTKFWIGLRCTAWNWQDIVSGTSFEMTDTRFGTNSPNNTSPECLASYPDVYGNMYWVNRNCSTDLPFICQQYISATTTTRTTMSTTRTTRRPTPTNVDTTAATQTYAPTKPSTNKTSSTTLRDPTTIYTPRKSPTPLFSSLPNDSMATGSTPNMPAVTRSSDVTGTPSVTVQFRKSTPGPVDTKTANSDKYDLIDLLVLGIIGGLFLAGIVWLATLTARIKRVYDQKSNQERHIGSPCNTYSNPYEISPFNDAHALKEMPSSAIGGAEKPFEDQRM